MSDDSGDEREGGRGGYSVSQLEVVVGAGLYFSLLCSLEKRLEVRMGPNIWRRAILTLSPHTYTDNVKTLIEKQQTILSKKYFFKLREFSFQ